MRMPSSAILLLVTVAPCVAPADNLRGHIVGSGIRHIPTETFYFNSTTGGISNFTLGPATGRGELGAAFTEATASSGGTLSPTSILGVHASCSAFGAVANVAAFGAYRDVVSISGVTPPAQVRITMRAHAHLGVVGIPSDAASDGNAAIAAGFLQFTEENSFSFGGALARYTPNLANSFNIGGWDTSSGPPSDFVGTFSSVLSFDSQRGGYPFQAAISMSGGAFVGVCNAGASDALAFVSVTNIDGSPISGATFTFASGLSLCTADFNGDSTLDFFDYLDFVSAFSSGLPVADFNRDGTIDFFDYLDFVGEFSIGC